MAVSASVAKQAASIQAGINKAAAALGPSAQAAVAKAAGSSSSYTEPAARSAGVGYQTYNPDGSVNQSFTNEQAKVINKTGVLPNAITSDLLTPTTPAVIPTAPVPSPLGTTTMTQMAGLGAATPATTPTPTATPATSTASSFAEQLKSLMPKSVDTAGIYAKAEQDSQLQAKQQSVNNYTAQLNAITAKSTADKLSVTGQGRGIPEAIIGGQQAQIDKEAAIQSLPIAAQLSAAQGDLKAAQDHVDTLFKLRSQDATNEYNSQMKIAELAMNYATEEQKNILAERVRMDTRAHSDQQDNLNYARQLSTAAISNGQPSLAASIMKLDPSSTTYTSDIANLAKGIYVEKKSGSGGGTLEERQASAISNISSKFVNGAKTPSGVPILDPSGYITPIAWKDMIKHAPEAGLTRSSFISNFGSQLYIDSKTKKPSDSYGLTPKEIKDLGYE